jgi:mannose-6-phosphate isomerase-like protein (cupin superfamily)
VAGNGEEEMDHISKTLLNDALQKINGVSTPVTTPKPRNQNPADHWTPTILMERAAYLRKMAENGNGSASETLKDYPHISTRLCFRNRDGVAESHANFSDIFIIIDGRVTLVTGGKLVNAKSEGPGEMRANSIEGGTRQELKAGDVVHIPAGVPHQMLTISEKPITNIVLKIAESL